jgi:hypothetical protein
MAVCAPLPEQPNDIDRVFEQFLPNVDGRPLVTQDMLVQVLTSAEPPKMHIPIQIPMSTPLAKTERGPLQAYSCSSTDVRVRAYNRILPLALLNHAGLFSAGPLLRTLPRRHTER